MRSCLLLFALVGAVLATNASAATVECAGIPTCIDVPGPWVAVPASGEAKFLLDCPQRRSAGLGHGSPGIGQPDPPPIALQELQADRVLEVAELLGDRRLGQVEGGRRARNVLVLGDRDKGAKLLDGECRSTHLDILVRLMKDITNNCAKRLNEC